MIVIWNNGEAYSGKRIFFVDTGEHSVDEVLAVLQLVNMGGKGYEIARVPSLDWRAPESISTPKELITDADNPWKIEEAEVALFRQLSAPLLQRFLDHLSCVWMPDEIEVVEQILTEKRGA